MKGTAVATASGKHIPTECGTVPSRQIRRSETCTRLCRKGPALSGRSMGARLLATFPACWVLSTGRLMSVYVAIPAFTDTTPLCSDPASSAHPPKRMDRGLPRFLYGERSDSPLGVPLPWSVVSSPPSLPVPLGRAIGGDGGTMGDFRRAVDATNRRTHRAPCLSNAVVSPPRVPYSGRACVGGLVLVSLDGLATYPSHRDLSSSSREGYAVEESILLTDHPRWRMRVHMVWYEGAFRDNPVHPIDPGSEVTILVAPHSPSAAVTMGVLGGLCPAT